MMQSELRLYFWLLKKKKKSQQKPTPHPKILLINLSASVFNLVEYFPSTALPMVWSTEWLCRNNAPLVLNHCFLVSSLNSVTGSLYTFISVPTLRSLLLPFCYPEQSCSSSATALSMIMPSWSCTLCNYV